MTIVDDLFEVVAKKEILQKLFYCLDIILLPECAECGHVFEVGDKVGLYSNGGLCRRCAGSDTFCRTVMQDGRLSYSAGIGCCRAWLVRA